MRSLFACALLSVCLVSGAAKADGLEDRVSSLENSVREQAVQSDLLRRDVDRLKTQVAALPTLIGVMPHGTTTYNLKNDCSQITQSYAYSYDYYLFKVLGEKQCPQGIFVTAQYQVEGGVGIFTAKKTDLVYFTP